ncbi:MAG: hypothetical protein JWN90_397 [Parcubacteria group bacterium]|nr:hypothetical protein [Parcubacteria group bacterium]
MDKHSPDAEGREDQKFPTDPASQAVFESWDPFTRNTPPPDSSNTDAFPLWYPR